MSIIDVMMDITANIAIFQGQIYSDLGADAYPLCMYHNYMRVFLGSIVRMNDTASAAQCNEHSILLSAITFSSTNVQAC